MSDRVQPPMEPPPRKPVHATLREALAAAAQGMPELVNKGGWHEQKRFEHVRHEDVLSHTRGVLLSHGVKIVHGDLRFVDRIESRQGNHLLLWEQSIAALHVGTEERLEAKLVIATLPDDGAASKASTAADRLFRMRLCELAGGAEHVPEDKSQRGRGRREDVDPDTGEVKPDPKAQESAVAEALKHLAKRETEAQLVDWFHIARGNLDRVSATDEQRTRVWAAFEKRCKEARLDAEKLAERARAPSNNRRTTKE